MTASRQAKREAVKDSTGEAMPMVHPLTLTQHGILDSYLAATAAVTKLTFDSWALEEQLAFLINVYNAATVALILTEYPDLESIRDIGTFLRSPWSREFVALFGGKVTLDNIEHDMIRGWNIYNEPRIHFAVNCFALH